LGAQKFGKERFPPLLELDQILDEAIGSGQLPDARFDPVQFALELSKSPGHSNLLAKIQRLLEGLMIERRSSNHVAKMGNSCACRARSAIFPPPAEQSISINARARRRSARESAGKHA
jgi:hypothetical protein